MFNTQSLFASEPCASTQAWYARDFILGRIELPTRDQMASEWAEWRAREEGLEGDEANIRFQADMVKSLIEQTDYPSFNIEGVVQVYRG